MSKKKGQFVANLKANRPKLLVAAALLAVGMLLWGRLLWNQMVPKTAVAVPPKQTNAGGAKNSAQTTGAATTAAPAARQVVVVDLPSDFTRDLFAINRSLFAIKPPPPEKVAKKPPQIKVVTEKPLPDPADVMLEVKQAARELILQTTVVGEQPRAIINGQVLRPGEKIGQFVVRRIFDRHVVLEMNGFEIDLEM